MISMPVRSPLCTVRSKRLAGERLLVDRAVGIAVEHAAGAIFQLDDAPRRVLHQLPGEFLIVEVAAAFDRVGEMLFQRIVGMKDGVVAALHHARASALAEQAFHGDDDFEPARDLVRMHGGQKAGAARAQDQDVRFQILGVQMVHQRFLKAVIPQHAQTMPSTISAAVMACTARTLTRL